jgi:predicted CxxxxCH...CXXCH cytochrome family protein
VTKTLQPSHFPLDGGAPDLRAEVVMAGAQASFDFTTLTCKGSTCHNPSQDPTPMPGLEPRWTNLDAGVAACGTCHGLPPITHNPADTACARCHPVSLAGGGVLVSVHANGVVNLGHTLPDGTAPNPATCGSCHGDGPSFFDTFGRTDTTLPTVGLHTTHLRGARGLSAPVTCVDCHQVPARVQDPGHLDLWNQPSNPAEVFPDIPGVGVRARADGAQPVYQPASATCANVYCHGAGTLYVGDGGARYPGDTSPILVKVWPWTFGIGLTCGNCHGAPPNTPIHTGTTTLTRCNQCHGPSVDTQGHIILTTLPDGGVTSTHLNGQVEVVAQ